MKTNKLILTTVLAFSCSFTFAQLKIINSGNVGVGTLTPVSKFHVMGYSTFTANAGSINSAAFIRGNNNFSTATAPDYTWYNSDVTGLFHPSQNEIGFATYGVERMRITNTFVYFANSAAPITSAPIIKTTNSYSTPTTPDFTWYNNDWAGIYHPAQNTLGFSTAGMERLKINATGQVSIGGNPNGSYLLTVNGSSYCTGSWISSDKRYKKNIKTIDNALSKVLKLNGASYDYKLDEFKGKNFSESRTFGFIAQEIKDVLPEVVKIDNDGFYSVNYDEIIPLLVESIKDLNRAIEVQKEKISELLNNSGNTADLNNSTVVAKLYQNIPNPFSQSTIIKTIIPAESQHVEIYIYDMQGVQIKKISLSGKGEVNTVIQGSELKAGMYMYSLIIDTKEIDTKKMILTN